MRICFIGDSSSVHLKRLVSYYTMQQDDVLVLSTSVSRSHIAGARTVHLIACGNSVSITRDQEGPMAWTGLWKSLIPRPLRSYARRTIRDLRVLRARKVCVQEILRFKPDVFFCNRSFPEGVLASFCRVRPLLLRTAGQDISKLPKYPIYRQLICRALRSASVVLTQSIWERNWLRTLCGDELNVAINVIGIDLSLFRPRVDKEISRKKYGLQSDAFVAITNRYLTGIYNGWDAVKAVESVLEKCPKLTLLYVTPVKMDRATRRKADAIMQKFSRIRFLEGPLTHCEMAEVLSCGDLYVSFSSYDGVPNSVLEAMSSGVVPIVADLPQLREWIEDGIDGYIVPQRDVKKLALRLLEVYQNRHTLAELSSLCVEKIRKRASYEMCSKQTRDLVRSIARRPSSAMQKSMNELPVHSSVD